MEGLWHGKYNAVFANRQRVVGNEKRVERVSMGIPFPLFHFETYLDLEDYKQRVKEEIKAYKGQQL